jgi:uncharacterized protein
MFEAPLLDPKRFALQGDVLEGRAAPGDLKRLEGSVHSGEGYVHYRIAGRINSRGWPVLSVHLDGQLMLTCQRCLGPVSFNLAVDDQLVMVPDESALPALEEEEPGVDVIVQPDRIDVAELLEDEILLALPLAPCHEAGECPGEPEVKGTERENPFAVLAKLKTTSSQ